MTDVFISYSQKAAGPTKVLAAQLEGLGYVVWWDKGLLAGEKFDDAIREKLEDAGAIVVIWTAEAAVSEYVKLEAGIAWFRDKLISLRISDLRVQDIPTLFQSIHTIDVDDFSAIVSALESRGVQPSVEKTGRKLSKEEIMLSLSRIERTLPAKVDNFLKRCKEEGFRVQTKRSFTIKAPIPKAGEINFGSLSPDGTFQTYYISESAEKLGHPSIAADYLDALAKLVPGGSVKREKTAWTWRVESSGELPRIETILPKSEAWIELMKLARSRFIEATTSKSD